MPEHLSISHISSQGIGYHTLFDYFVCASPILDDIMAIKTMMIQAAIASGAEIIGEHSHRFEPYGISCIIILAESHLSLHTWPEHHFVAADLFSCSPKIDAIKAGEVFVKTLRPQSTQCSVHQRGRPHFS